MSSTTIDLTSDDSQLSVATQESAYDYLVREIAELKSKLDKVGSNVSAENRVSSKRLGIVPARLNENDAKVIANEVADVTKRGGLFKEWKFLPKGYEVFSKDNHSICGLIMSKMNTTPVIENNGITEKQLWEKYIAKTLSARYVLERNGSNQIMRKQFMREYIVLIELLCTQNKHQNTN